MNGIEFWQSQGDYTLFIKRSHMGKLTVVIIYVHNIIVIGDDYAEIEKT